MSTVKEVALIREILEKDVHYLKEKIDGLDKKFDDELKPLKEENKLNTKFRERFTWTKTLIISISSIIAFLMSIIAFRFEWFTR